MKKMEMPEMKFVELTAGDVIATSDEYCEKDYSNCEYVCEGDCWNQNAAGCRQYCDWYCEEENIGDLYCDFLDN